MVSVVVPTYNRVEYLERAVESVADQTYDEIELLIVDDCSDVDVEERLDWSFSGAFERVEFIRHEENRGGSAARNTGIERATGEYIALLDDDDKWEPEKIARQVKRFREDDVGAVFTGGRVVNERGQTLRVARAPSTVPESSNLTKRLLCRNFVGSCSVIMVAADVVDTVGTFDERFPSWQDQEWYVRLSRHCEFGAIPEPLVVYSEESPHRVSDNVETIQNETYPLFVRKFEPIASEYGRLFKRKMLAWAAYRVGKANAMANRITDARAYLTRAVRLYPFEPRFYKYLFPSLGGRVTYRIARKVRHGPSRLR